MVTPITMDRLPVELVANICSFLEPRDIGHLRCVSRFYAHVGRPFMFRQLHLIFKPESFERLHAICSNPTLAPYVTSLYYEADTLPFYECFDEWELHLIDPAIFPGLDFVHPPGPNSSERARRAYQRQLKKLKIKPRHLYSQPQLATAYQKYLDYSKEQDAMRRDNYHAGKIADALAQLPHLQEITMSLEGWEGQSKRLKNSYSDTLVIPEGDNSWTEPLGVPQMLSLLQGSARTQMKLKRLGGGPVDWKFFQQSDEVFEELQKAVRNLQELKLGLSTGCEEAEDSLDGVETFGIETQECAEYLQNGRLRDFLAAAPNLRLLDLQFDWCNPNCPADLRYVFGKHKWDFLRDVTLSTFDSRAEDLLSFCETHAMTLRRLVLDEIKLVEGSWPSTFQEMRRLLHLEGVRICGDLESSEFGEDWCFTMMESEEDTTMSRDVQEYLLQGGDGPLLDLSQYNELTKLELAALEASLSG